VISASAPGKVILWGEYAVLAGAPAMVMAVDRRAVCRIEPTTPRASDARVWRFTSQGFSAPEIDLEVSRLSADTPPEHAGSLMFWHVIRELLRNSDRSALPAGARIVTDSQEFYQDGKKLGIGSSAAVCVAVYAASCELLGVRCDFKQALNIHNRFQDKLGSGIDVAAAYHGGSLRFQAQHATPFDLAPHLQLRFIWTGHAAKTIHHIQRFNAWIELGAIAPLTTLANTSEALFEHADLATLGRYCNELKELDAAAELGIYSDPHAQLDHLAIDAEVVYKPCGAGGGDIGVAISDDAARLDAFVAAAVDLGFDSIALEKASNGVQVAR
jgi:phosphomevalonate kinase